MACLSSEKLQDYLEKNLGTVENAMIRDHLITCEKCKKEYQAYLELESILKKPVYAEPPAVIERFVMSRLYSRLPAYTSIFAFISLGFVLLISWIYIYFDFANNSLVQALRIASSSTSRWIGSIIQFISGVFSSVYAVFKALDKFFGIVFNVNMGVELLSLLVFLFTVTLFFAIFQVVSRRSKSSKSHNGA